MKSPLILGVLWTALGRAVETACDWSQSWVRVQRFLTSVGKVLHPSGTQSLCKKRMVVEYLLSLLHWAPLKIP